METKLEREGQRTNVTSQEWKTKLEPENQRTEVELGAGGGDDRIKNWR